jgi:hypothetical protein
MSVAVEVETEKPTIQAVDEPEGTIYVLRRPGRPPLYHSWPQPLLQLEPEAVRIFAWTGEDHTNF